MKLFITNKRDLDDLFPNSKEIHQEAFRQLQLSLNTKFAIPLCLTPSYKEEGIVLLDFVNKKDDVYFYEFTTTAS